MGDVWGAVAAAFDVLGRAAFVLDDSFVVLRVSDCLNGWACDGATERAVGKHLGEILGQHLFDPEDGIEAALRRGGREEGRRAFLHCPLTGVRLVSMTAAPVDPRQAAALAEGARYLVVIRPVEQTQQGRTETSDALVARSAGMLQIIELVEALHRSSATVLITGESGTGKEVVARALHTHSPNRKGPFVAVNCAALPADLLESELFGHARGAFTGAIRDRDGRFETAGEGTLFLDEIGDMPASLQAKLLRVLQERSFERLGEDHPRRFGARVIAATNVNLGEAVRLGRFREDLFYRLRVVPIHVPPLRERPEDIEPLAGHLLERIGGRTGRALRLSPDLIVELKGQGWPGNVRELENALEYASAIAQGQTIQREDLPPGLQGDEPSSSSQPASHAAPGPGAPSALKEAGQPEADRILAELERHRWRRGNVARALGLSRTTLWRKMKALGLE